MNGIFFFYVYDCRKKVKIVTGNVHVQPVNELKRTPNQFHVLSCTYTIIFDKLINFLWELSVIPLITNFSVFNIYLNFKQIISNAKNLKMFSFDNSESDQECGAALSQVENKFQFKCKYCSGKFIKKHLLTSHLNICEKGPSTSGKFEFVIYIYR